MTKIEQRRKLLAEAYAALPVFEATGTTHARVPGNALIIAAVNDYAALLEIAKAAQEQVRHPHNPRSLDALAAASNAWEQTP